jgi:hypothetical protein
MKISVSRFIKLKVLYVCVVAVLIDCLMFLLTGSKIRLYWCPVYIHHYHHMVRERCNLFYMRARHRRLHIQDSFWGIYKLTLSMYLKHIDYQLNVFHTNI